METNHLDNILAEANELRATRAIIDVGLLNLEADYFSAIARKARKRAVSIGRSLSAAAEPNTTKGTKRAPRRLVHTINLPGAVSRG